MFSNIIVKKTSNRKKNIIEDLVKYQSEFYVGERVKWRTHCAVFFSRLSTDQFHFSAVHSFALIEVFIFSYRGFYFYVLKVCNVFFEYLFHLNRISSNEPQKRSVFDWNRRKKRKTYLIFYIGWVVQDLIFSYVSNLVLISSLNSQKRKIPDENVCVCVFLVGNHCSHFTRSTWTGAGFSTNKQLKTE